MPEILHQSHGLTIKKNDRNRFIVATLYYYADPAKRSPEWEVEARAGLTDAQFRQEYLIDYFASFGTPVFPEFRQKKGDIVCTSPFLDGGMPERLTCWGGFDYGARNPSSFHVYTIFDQTIYAIWELYEPCKNILDFAAKMLACPYWNQIQFIAADPDLFSLKHRDMVTGATTAVANEFQALKVNKLCPGNSDEAAWIAQMHKLWMGDRIGFKIFTCCPNLIRELEEAMYVAMNDKALQSGNLKEKMVDRHNHALDDCKYFINSQPSAHARKPVTMPRMVDLWKF